VTKAVIVHCPAIKVNYGWEGTVSRMTPEPGDLPTYTSQSLLRGERG